MISYKSTYEFVNLAPIVTNPDNLSMPSLELIDNVVKSKNMEFYSFKELPTISDMIQKFHSERERYKSNNRGLSKIEVVSFSELSKEDFDILTRKPATESKEVVEYPCKQNRNPKECSINLYTKGGCNICFYKK